MRLPDQTVALAESARPLGWDLDAGQADRLLAYLRAVLAASERVNLTAIRDFDEGIRRHLLDSLAFGLHLKESGAGRASPVWLDMGTGGGFPGAIAAIVHPQSLVHLVESRGRKLEAVRQIAKTQGITNLRFHHARLGEIRRAEPAVRGAVDLIFARGVGVLADIIEEAVPALRPPSGTLLCWKSASLGDQERRAGDKAASRCGLVPLPDLSYESYKPCLLVRYRREGAVHAR